MKILGDQLQSKLLFCSRAQIDRYYVNGYLKKFTLKTNNFSKTDKTSPEKVRIAYLFDAEITR
jgi:hypothetical protein